MKPGRTAALKEVDSAEIVSLVDNLIDFLSSIEREGVQQVREWVKERRGEEWFEEHFRPPLAEHGFSMLVRVFCDNKMYAIIGGFHLAGREFECRIDQTVRELKLINPSILVPSHCTGWRAIFKFASAMPAAVVWNSVGNLHKF